jgi:hypothetical protein
LRPERVSSWWSTRYHPGSASRFISSLVDNSRRFLAFVPKKAV